MNVLNTAGETPLDQAIFEKGEATIKLLTSLNCRLGLISDLFLK